MRPAATTPRRSFATIQPQKAYSRRSPGAGGVSVVLAGVLRESIVIETPVEIRNEVGEATQEWVEFARRRAGVEQIGYTELQRMNQTGGSATFTVRLRYVAGVSVNMRIRWVSRANRILYIASIVESGNRQEHEFTCEERA